MSSRSKKKRLRKELQNSVADGVLTPDYIETESPFKNIPQEDIKRIGQFVGEKNEKDFHKNLEELIKFLRNFDVVDLPAWFSFYYLIDKNAQQDEMPEETEILQFHVELLQALLLRNDYTNVNDMLEPITPFNTEKVKELIKNVANAYELREIKDFYNTDDDSESKKNECIEKIRSDTVIVRNWGYPEQVMRITKGIFEKLDEDIKLIYGISTTCLIDTFEKLIKEIEKRCNSHIEKIRRIFACKDKIQIIRTYKNFFPAVESSDEELLKYSRSFSSRKEFQTALVRQCDMFIRDLYIFSIDEITNLCPGVIVKEKLTKVLDMFSCTYGELSDLNPESFFLENPIWQKPFVKINETSYALPIPSLFYNISINMIEQQMINQNPKLKEKYLKCRAEYLENSVKMEFQKGFPISDMYEESIWHEETENKDYENDLLVVVDSYAIAIEDKSGRITRPAKRGAPDRLKRDIQKLIVEPSIQARRFAAFLEKNLGKVIELKSKKSKKNIIDLTNVRKVLTFSITLDLFGALGTNLTELYNAGFIKEKLDLSPCMSLADLEIVLELLETSGEKIHYFSRRYELDKNAEFIADEMDLLVFYLETGFNIGDSEYNGMQLILYGASSKLDYYYLSKYHGFEKDADKPKHRITKWWSDVLKKIEERKIPRWTEFSYIFLNVSFEDQLKFEEMFNEVVEEVDKNWGKPKSKNHVVLCNGNKNDLLIAFAYKQIGRTARNSMIENIAAKSFDANKCYKRALIIGVDISNPNYPYNVIAVLDKKQS